MQKQQVLAQLQQEFSQWEGGVESALGVWYACAPPDIPESKALVSMYDLYISKDNTLASANLRSAYCMVEQIDTHFCPNDLTNFPGHEAMKNKNRSTKHFECPVCFSHLNTITNPSESEASTYLSCAWCHWSSQSIGLATPDVESLFRTARTSEKELLAQKSLISLEEEMAHLAGQLNNTWVDATRQRELLMRQARGAAYMPGSSHGETPAPKSMQEVESDWEHRQRQLLGGLEGSEAQTLISPSRSPLKPTSAMPDSSVVSETATLCQRLQQPHNQSRELRGLVPRRMDLMTKRSKRCPVSKGLIVKPELNPSKATFAKKCDAISTLPRATVIQPVDKSGGFLFVRFSNPLSSQVTIHIAPWELDQQDTPPEGYTQPYLFQVQPLSTTIGEGFLEPGVVQPLLDSDDPVSIISRTSDSVIVKLTSSTPVTTGFVQARISVTAEAEFFADIPEITSMEFQFVINYEID